MQRGTRGPHPLYRGPCGVSTQLLLASRDRASAAVITRQRLHAASQAHALASKRCCIDPARASYLTDVPVHVSSGLAPTPGTCHGSLHLAWFMRRMGQNT